MLIVCISCKCKIRVPDNAAGKKGKCPKCATIQSLPPRLREMSFPDQAEPLHSENVMPMTCEKCGTPISISTIAEGETLSCPTCGHPFVQYSSSVFPPITSFEISAKCPECDAAYLVPAEAAGKAIKCANCNAKILIPANGRSGGDDGKAHPALGQDPDAGADSNSNNREERRSTTVYPEDRPSGIDVGDAEKVERLLSRIASQSHFEERYQILSAMDRGGMGVIRRAFDHILRREVAIKMMHDGIESSVAVRGQFLKEARIGARLLHPHILPVFDLGVNKAGQIYYTMRLVDGASLGDCLLSLDKAVGTKLVAYPLRKIVQALVRACHGVDYAHQNRVLHLDLKPQNILVSGFDEVFVIDWGLAKDGDVDDTDILVDLYRNRSAAYETTTRTGVGGDRVIGTPAYMAPEQVTGNYKSFDPTTDVYALGGILYYILYGKHPNEGRTAVETMAAIQKPKKRGTLRQGILPRGQRVRKEVREAIDALESICLNALEVDREKRHQDAEKLIVDLNEWLSKAPGITIES